ncbi:MAG: hypothetical protein RL693_357 [Verrucomicrobiota bacterium]|jgi:hypothetical protein
MLCISRALFPGLQPVISGIGDSVLTRFCVPEKAQRNEMMPRKIRCNGDTEAVIPTDRNWLQIAVRDWFVRRLTVAGLQKLTVTGHENPASSSLFFFMSG